MLSIFYIDITFLSGHTLAIKRPPRSHAVFLITG